MQAPDIEITQAEIGAIIAPWVIQEYSKESLAWQSIRAREKLRIQKKRILRSIKSLVLSSVKSRAHHRTPEYVRDTYSETWSRYTLPDSATMARSEKIRFIEWNGAGYSASPFAVHRCHLLGIAKALASLDPSSVLEVGAGPGISLFALSSAHPAIRFAGIELTSAGIEAARLVQKAPLPDRIERIAPLPVKSRTAHQAISFTQGDVQNMPFPDQSFDLVFTRLAIEQMEQIRERAFAEIHRVTKCHAVFVEPFADFNLDPLQTLATRTKNFISLNVADLGSYGFEPVARFADWPHKITNGAGMVVCRKL